MHAYMYGYMFVCMRNGHVYLYNVCTDYCIRGGPG